MWKNMMWKTRKIIALLILLTVPGTLPIVAHSAGCFDSVFLGQYVLGNWNGPGPNSDSERWEVGGIVGTNESFATKKGTSSAHERNGRAMFGERSQNNCGCGTTYDGTKRYSGCPL